MFDGLRSSQQTGIEGRHALIFVHDLLALVDDSQNRIACLTPGRFLDQSEHLLKSINLAFGLHEVLFEGNCPVRIGRKVSCTDASSETVDASETEIRRRSYELWSAL